MTLIEAERDDAALLAAEDAAILDAARPAATETADDIADLIERLTSDHSQVPPEGGEGGDRRAG